MQFNFIDSCDVEYHFKFTKDHLKMYSRGLKVEIHIQYLSDNYWKEYKPNGENEYFPLSAEAIRYIRKICANLVFA